MDCAGLDYKYGKELKNFGHKAQLIETQRVGT